MLQEIKFGTDGWRAVIGDGFTFQNLKNAVQATCDVLRKTSKSRLIIIGYDCRFFSNRFAEVAAQVALGNGFKVEIASEPIGSPVLSIAVKEKKAALGFMITASHNPSQFNGFKLKGPQGGSVDVNFTKTIEDRIGINEVKLGKGGLFKKADCENRYFKFLRKVVNVNAVKKIKSPVVFDAMHSPGGILLEKFIGKQDRIKIINKNPDPLFGGINPEPIEQNLHSLIETVKETKAAAGFAVDGDCDRIGVVDDKGRYLPPHTVMPLILLHLLENRKLKGKVIQTVSMGYLPQRIAKEFKAPYEEVAVGFKNIAAKMHHEKVAFGGEESGGYGVGIWFPERDGILCALLILELMSLKKRPLSVLVDELYQRFGASHFKRVDFPLDRKIDLPEWVQLITTNIGQDLAGKPIRNINSMDGVKITLEDDSWVLMRPSGTEPLVRTYSESPSSQTVNELLAEADRLIHIKPPPPPKSGKKSGKKKEKKKPR